MNTITVESGQHLIDIAMQAYATADGLGWLCEANDLEFDADLVPGMKLIIPDRPLTDMQQFYNSRRIKVNSHLATPDINVLTDNLNQPIVTNHGDLINV